MIVVIIAGGSGTRLWPISMPNYPKHLLNISGSNSLLQDTYNRAKFFSKDIYVITEKSHAHHVKEQLPELGNEAFIVEPGRRGTASCLIAALNHLEKHHNKDEPIAFVSADHHVRDNDGFAHSFRLAENIAKKESRIVLIGIEPTYPATGFGYIEKGQLLNSDDSGGYNVRAFKEKPEFNIAREYVSSGKYLWNCGYFVGTLDTFKKELDQHAKSLAKNLKLLRATKTNNDYEKVYLSFKNDTIDYALIEKINNLAVVPGTFDWVDVGSFKDLHEVNEQDQQGVHKHGNAISIEVENSYIRNEEDKPLAVIGLDNVVIINTKNGILVSRKDMSQKVKDAVNQMKENQ